MPLLALVPWWAWLGAGAAGTAYLLKEDEQPAGQSLPEGTAAVRLSPAGWAAVAGGVVAAVYLAKKAR